MPSELEDYLTRLPFVREPRAELRQAAAGLHEAYTAYVMEGFTPGQALSLVMHLLTISGTGGEA